MIPSNFIIPLLLLTTPNVQGQHCDKNAATRFVSSLFQKGNVRLKIDSRRNSTYFKKLTPDEKIFKFTNLMGKNIPSLKLQRALLCNCSAL